jgi:hypothetical protein
MTEPPETTTERARPGPVVRLRGLVGAVGLSVLLGLVIALAVAVLLAVLALLALTVLG